MGIQSPMNREKLTGLSQFTLILSDWDSCSCFPQCTVTTVMGNRFAFLNFNPLVNSSLKHPQEWYYWQWQSLSDLKGGDSTFD